MEWGWKRTTIRVHTPRNPPQSVYALCVAYVCAMLTLHPLVDGVETRIERPRTHSKGLWVWMWVQKERPREMGDYARLTRSMALGGWWCYGVLAPAPTRWAKMGAMDLYQIPITRCMKNASSPLFVGVPCSPKDGVLKMYALCVAYPLDFRHFPSYHGHRSKGQKERLHQDGSCEEECA